MIDHGPGVLMPALINAHTHLELGALKGKIPCSNGFESWVRHLLKARADLTSAAMMTGIWAGIEELETTGCGAIGEIATLGLSENPFFASTLGGIWFKEHLGDQLSSLSKGELIGARRSWAGHAPHTTSPALLAHLKNETRRHHRPFSIHLSESPQEVEFIQSAQGAWADFLTERRIDFSSWPLPSRSPVAYLDQLGLLDERTLAVHVLQADAQDFKILAEHNVAVIVCPRSNQRLHRQSPNITGMLEAGLRVCLGTDSLASCDSLNLFDEMAATARQFPGISPQTLLSMATIHGAASLGLKSQFGTLNPGDRFTAIYAPVAVTKPNLLLEYIAHNQLNNNIKQI